MRKFRFALILAAGAAMQFAPLSQPASAADLGGGYKDTPYVVVPWQGLYFGAHAGGAESSAGVHDSFNYVGDPNFNSSGSSTGLIGGGQAGYNVQQGHMVFGVEGDIGYLGISAKSSGAYTPSSNPGNIYCGGYWAGNGHVCDISGQYNTSGGLYGDITGRLGYATDRVLFYAKGGVAFLDADTKANYKGGSTAALNTNSYFNFDNSQTLVGWTIGAGAEYAVNPAWSIKAEYQHFDFGSMSYNYSGDYTYPNVCGGNCIAHLTDGKNTVSITADTVKVGVNYHVGN